MPTNKERGEAAFKALLAYMHEKDAVGDSPLELLTDLVTDLQHYCDHFLPPSDDDVPPWETALRAASDHYVAEITCECGEFEDDHEQLTGRCTISDGRPLVQCGCQAFTPMESR